MDLIYRYLLYLDKPASYGSAAAHTSAACSTAVLCSSIRPWSIRSSSNVPVTLIWGSQKLAGSTTNQRSSLVWSCFSMVKILCLVWIYYAIHSWDLPTTDSVLCWAAPCICPLCFQVVQAGRCRGYIFSSWGWCRVVPGRYWWICLLYFLICM